MVEFHRGEDDGVWKIVEKLGALVEEGGIVLVAFEDEILSAAQLKTAAEVFSDPTNEK